MKLNLDDFKFLVNEMADVIIKNEVYFCELDSVAGDGDFGMSVAKGFKQLKKEWNDLDDDSISTFIRSCAMVIMEHCGGASGPIWGSAFRGASKALKGVDEVGVVELAEAMQGSVKAIQRTGEKSFGRGAQVGDKTLIDALVPFADSLEKSGKAKKELIPALELASKEAVKGAEATKKIEARMGRAANVGERSLGHPDAGACALGIIFTEVTKSLKKKKAK